MSATSSSSTPESRARIAFGLFAVVLAIAAVAAYFYMGAQHRIYEVRSPDNVSGLIRGAPVEFHGVEVGKVDDVQLADARNVRVIIEVDKDVPVTSATVATITGRGLAARGFTGYVYVSLEDTGAGGQALVADAGSGYPRIATAPSQGASLDTSIHQLNDSVQAAVALLRTTLDAQTIASLKHSVANLDEVTRTLAANNARLQAIVLNAERTTAQMPLMLQAGTQTLGAMRTQLLPQAGGTLVQMNGVIASTQDTVDQLRTQLLPQAQQTVTRMDALTGTLADTADRVKRNPAVLVRGMGPRPGPGEAP